MINDLKNKVLWIVFCLLNILIVNGQIVNTQVKAELKIIERDNYIDIISVAHNNTNYYINFYFDMRVIKNDKKNWNSSKSSQSGRKTLKPNENSELTQTTINSNGSSAEVIVLLLFYDNDKKMIGRDRVVFKSGKKVLEKVKQEVVELPERNDGIELTGIVVENTKTKAGKDFYDFFYNKYLYSEKKGNKVVTISEFIFSGRQSRIDIKIDEKEITKFFVRPNEEYLEAMADVVLRRVQKYFSDVERNKEFITKY